MTIMDIIDILNFAIAVAGITVSVLGLVLSLRAEYMRKKSRRFFFLVFLILTVYTASDLLSQISLVFLGVQYAPLSRAAVYTESLSSSVAVPLIATYMLSLSGSEAIKKERLFLLNLLLWTVYAVLLSVNLFTDIFYYITAENEYRRSPLYPVLLVPTVAMMLVNLIGLLRRKDKLTAKQFRAFLAWLLIPAVGMVLQMASYGILFIVLTTSAAAFVMFIYILDDQAKKTMEQAIRLSDQNLRIKNLQMRPHFVYNTLSNIYYLCDIDPKRAQKVINDFTVYLRKNFSAVAQEGLIPFEDELAHTKAFLSVAKARYESFLQVDYEIAFTDFFVPPLTLEPIAENAVKHGLDPERGALLIRISTRLDEGFVLITVENSGAELTRLEIDPSAAEGEDPHIGLANVSTRLEALCGGAMKIEPRTGGGAIVHMKIPKNKA